MNPRNAALDSAPAHAYDRGHTWRRPRRPRPLPALRKRCGQRSRPERPPLMAPHPEKVAGLFVWSRSRVRPYPGRHAGRREHTAPAQALPGAGDV